MAEKKAILLDIPNKNDQGLALALQEYAPKLTWRHQSHQRRQFF
jgi:hypothetical protein